MNDTSMGDGESVAGSPEADHHNNFDFLRFVAASLVLYSLRLLTALCLVVFL